MYQNRKFFGMTGSQIGIVAGLGALVLCLFGVLGYLIFGGGFNLGRGPQLPPTPAPTVTPFVIPTITPTPLPTVIPYEQLIPTGWIQYRTPLIEIWFPPQYKLAKVPSSEGATTFATAEVFVSRTATLYNMFGAVAYEPLTTESLETFLDIKMQSLPAELRVVDRRATLLNGVPVVRLQFEGRANNIDINELSYVLQDGGTIWYVVYAAQINDFYENLEIFEDSAKTFRLLR